MSDRTERLIDDPEYVQGQIDSLRPLLLGLAQEVPEDRFRQMSLERLESLRNALLSQPVSESRLLAVDHFEDWVRVVTS